jgi:glycosyltransferase involved in cell wall biosynthesis
MQRRRPMRLLLREHGVSGGTETVNIHLIEQFTQLVERVVWIVPSWRMKFFQRILPPSDRLIYELPYCPPGVRLTNILRKGTSFALRRKTLPARFAFQYMSQALLDLWMRELIRQHEITHCFCNWTYGVNVPRIGVPIGAMLMDVRWKHLPETFPQVNLNAVERQFCHWLRKSSVVFPVSETTASDIRQFYPGHAGRMRVVPHGAQNPRRDERGSVTATVPREGGSVFFCPAAAHGHKNHITLFRACAEVFSKGFDFDVVLTGLGTEHFGRDQPNGQCQPCIEAAVEQARVFLHQNRDLFQGRIKALGYVDRTQIQELYNRCSAVVLPSFFEGFGLPLIEALQNGATVICSDIPAHREQLIRYGCTDQVALIPPTDASTLAAEMERVLAQASHRSTQKPVPPNALNEWTWRDVAEAYIDSLGAVTPSRNAERPGALLR